MADKKISATHLYERDSRINLSVYAFEASVGRVDVRIDGRGVQCGFELPAHLARELAAALIEQATAAEAIAAAQEMAA